MKKIGLVSFLILIGLFTSIYTQQCEDGEYYDENFDRCSSCPASCKTCTSQECTSCKATYELEDGKCNYSTNTDGIRTIIIIIIVVSVGAPLLIFFLICGICMCIFCCAASQVNKDSQKNKQMGQPAGFGPQNQFSATPFNANNWQQAPPPYQPAQGGYWGGGQNNWNNGQNNWNNGF